MKSNAVIGFYRDYTPSSFFAEKTDIVQDEFSRKYLSFRNTGEMLINYDTDILNTAYYSQIEIKEIENISINLGLRYDEITFWHRDDLGQKHNAKIDYDNLSPKLGMTYSFNDENGTYINYSKGFYAPGVSELFRARESNNDLNPAKFNNYEIGFWLRPSPESKVDISFYQMDGKDEIVSFRDINNNYKNRNSGQTRHQGIELSYNQRLTKTLSTTLNATYAKHSFIDYNTGNSDFSGNEQALAPRWISDLEFNYSPSFIKNFSIALQWVYRSNYWMDDLNSVRYEPRTLFDLKGNSFANLRFNYKYLNYHFNLKINNITDEYFANSASKTRWGSNYRITNPRTVSLSVDYEFTF